MDNESADRALLGCHLVFVVPTPVIQSPFSGKEFWVGRRVVVHNQQNFSLNVDVLKIIPFVFRSDHAITDKDDFGIFKTRRLVRLAAGHDEVFALLERQFLRFVVERDVVGLVGGDANERNFLEIGAVWRRGRKADFPDPQSPSAMRSSA